MSNFTKNEFNNNNILVNLYYVSIIKYLFYIKFNNVLYIVYPYTTFHKSNVCNENVCVPGKAYMIIYEKTVLTRITGK